MGVLLGFCWWKMASHVSDTERAIFWTKWRVQQCYRTAGSSEKCGEFCSNTTLKRKLLILVTTSVFLLFFLRTQIAWESEKSELIADPPDEENLMPRNPEVDPNIRINVNKQQDLIQAEKFEVNDVGNGFDQVMVGHKGKSKDGQGAENGNDVGTPVLGPPNNMEIVNKAKLPVLDDQQDQINDEAENNQKKKMQDIETLDEKLKAKEKKQKEGKRLSERIT